MQPLLHAIISGIPAVYLTQEPNRCQSKFELLILPLVVN